MANSDVETDDMEVIRDRVTAVQAWYATYDDETMEPRPANRKAVKKLHRERMHKATAIFKKLRPQSQHSQRNKKASQYIEYQVSKLEHTGSLLDQPSTGRPPTIKDEDMLKELADEVARGYTLWYNGEPVDKHFQSMKEAAVDIPHLNEVLTKYRVGTKHLLRRLHEVDPGLVYRHLHFRHKLTHENKAARLQAAKTRDKLSDDDHLATIFIDSKHFWVNNDHKVGVWMHEYDPLDTPDERVPVSGSGYPICWYLAVIGAAGGGLLWFDFITGTGKPFQTSIKPPIHRDKHGKKKAGFLVSVHQPATSDLL